MKLSAQEEFGIRCLLALAVEPDGGSLTIPEIAAREGLSPSHVAKLLGTLRRGGIVRSARGQAGGYSLAREASGIAVGEVLAVLGGRLLGDAFCERHKGGRASCVHDGDCRLLPLWASIQSAVDSVVEGMTLADLAAPVPNVRMYDEPLARTPQGV